MKKIPSRKSGAPAGATDTTKYASDTDTTKYASDTDTTKYASDTDTTKYASDTDTTKYASDADRTIYAQSPADERGSRLRGISASHRRMIVNAAIEEALIAVTASVDRVHPGISENVRAQLVATLLDRFSREFLDAHLDAAIDQIAAS